MANSPAEHEIVHSDPVPSDIRPDLDTVAIKSASSLIGLQFLSRLITFVVNQALVRLATPSVYGTVSIQLELLLNTILFLSREGFRNALLRANSNGKQQEVSITSTLVSNISILPIYLGFSITVLASGAYYYVASPETKSQPYFAQAVILYSGAAIHELFAEPYYIRCVQSLNPGIRVRAEGAAIIVRSAITLSILYLNSSTPNQRELYAFGMGQYLYSVTLLLVYIYEGRTLIPFRLKRVAREQQNPVSPSGFFSYKHLAVKLSCYFDQSLFEVSLAMTIQGFLKHILTEGDKFLVSRFSPLKDQGGYAVASNYGALIARIVFQPIEETSRLFFSKTLSVPEDKKSRTMALQIALSRLSSMLLLYSHLSLFLICLAPPYLNLVLAVMLPPKYLNTSAPSLLFAWIWYIPVLAMNGILEAFVSSAASPSELSRQSRWMSGASLSYIGLTVGLYHVAGLGDSAIIYANIINLLARIIYCVSFIVSYSKRFDVGKSKGLLWGNAFPPLSVILASGVGATTTRLSARVLNVEDTVRSMGRSSLQDKSCLVHASVGVASGLVILAVCYVSEKNGIKQLISIMSPGKQKKTD